MSEERIEIEEVEADIVQEGERAKSLDDVASNEQSASQETFGSDAKKSSAGTAYEEYSYVDNSGKVLGIISLIAGILSLLCCCIPVFSAGAGVLAIVLGIIALNRGLETRAMAIIGIICGCVGVVLFATGAIFAAIFKSAFDLIPDFFDSLGDFDFL